MCVCVITKTLLDFNMDMFLNRVLGVVIFESMNGGSGHNCAYWCCRVI